MDGQRTGLETPVANLIIRGRVISDHLLAMYLAMFAGFLVYLATSHILPEAHSRHSSRLTLLATITGTITMFGVVSLMSGLH